ncbi:MAG: hypothetical protein H6R10_3314 [Rhodocyclaceae bacterium]|nr:hypothetical protein [Rhodocyclaceae bacterium]
MLGRLARYLRAAGYDTELAAGGAPDRDLVRQAAEEGRYFLTCDRLILEHRAGNGLVCFLPHGHLDKLARQVGERFGIDWLARAFTRCLMDNTPLVPTQSHHHPDLPPDLAGRDIMRCPACQRVYWDGSHSRRMRARLEEWQRSLGP